MNENVTHLPVWATVLFWVASTIYGYYRGYLKGSEHKSEDHDG